MYGIGLDAGVSLAADLYFKGCCTNCRHPVRIARGLPMNGLAANLSLEENCIR